MSSIARSKLKTRAAAVLAATAAVAVAGSTATASAHEGLHYSSAYGFYVSGHGINSGPFGVTSWPSGPFDASIVDTHHDLVIAGVAQTHSTGDGSTGHAWASSSFTKVGFDLFNILPSLPTPKLLSVELNGAEAACHADNTGVYGSANFGSVTIKVLGKPVYVPAALPTNFKIGIPLLGSLTLNQQVKNADGSLDVTAFALDSDPVFNFLIQGNLNLHIAGAKCGPITSDTGAGSDDGGGHHH